MRHLRLPLSHAHAPSGGDASSPPRPRPFIKMFKKLEKMFEKGAHLHI